MHSNSTTHEAALIGLGAMGAALAHALLAKGRRITVWNRTAARAEPLQRAGAALAPDVAAAVAAAPVVIVCVTDYASTRALLEPVDLRGRVLVQLSTGTPQEARETAAWAAARGAQYLDGAILAIPSQIGGDHATILVSGQAAAFAVAGPLLLEMAVGSRFVGEQVGAASALDFGVLATVFGALLGFYHGARVIEAERLGVDDFGQLIVALVPTIGGMIEADAHTITSERYDAPESSLEICWKGMELLLRHAHEAAIDASFPGFAAGQFHRGITAGLGLEAPGALIKVLRAASAPKGARP